MRQPPSPRLSGATARRKSGTLVAYMPGMRPLALVLGLTALALAGCATQDATGSAYTGPTGPDDGASPLPQVDGSMTDDGTANDTTDGGSTHAGATGDAAAAAGSGQMHEICSQSFSGQATADPYWTPVGTTRMLALDGAGNMYVAAAFYGTVTVAGQIFDQSAGTGSLLLVKVDPACKVLWAKAFGASESGVSLAGLAADVAGNVVVAADLSGYPVDFGTGPIGPASTSLSVGVVFKLGPDGHGLWSHAYPGAFLSHANVSMVDVAVDSHGNTVFVAGMGVGGSIKGPPPTSPVPASVDFGGGAVTFGASLVELDDNGQFVFNVDASGLGVGGQFSPQNLTTDSTGRILVAGSDSGNPFEIVALDASGHRQWAQNVPPPSGSSNQWTPIIRVDPNADVFTAAAWLQQAADGGYTDDPLLYKFSPSGSPVWTPPAAIPQGVWGPEDQVGINGWWATWPAGHLAIDSAGRSVVSSTFAGSADFGSVGKLMSAGNLDSAVLRFDAQGRLIEGGRWGGAQDDVPVDVAVDAAGDAVIAGWSIPPPGGVIGPDAAQSSAPFTVFVAKLGW